MRKSYDHLIFTIRGNMVPCIILYIRVGSPNWERERSLRKERRPEKAIGKRERKPEKGIEKKERKLESDEEEETGKA